MPGNAMVVADFGLEMFGAGYYAYLVLLFRPECGQSLNESIVQF